MPKRVDLTGMRFGRLVATKQNGKSAAGSIKWDCSCDCGALVTVASNSLRTGNTTSCGCYNLDVRRNQKVRLRHGMSHTPEHNTWLEIKRRCGNERTKSFKHYGGRGISVCDRWRTYENFLEDMGRRPSDAHSIGRIDNNLGYSPENCRWETVSEQSKNRRNNVVVTAFGRTARLYEFVPIDGTRANSRTRNRIFKQGWPAEYAISVANEQRPRRPQRGDCAVV